MTTNHNCHDDRVWNAVSANSIYLAAAVALAAASVLAAPYALPDAYAEITFSATFGENGTGDGELDAPVGVALERSGRDIYVAERDNNRISIFANDHAFKEAFGILGSRDGDFKQPMSIIKVDRDYFILDAGNKRVKIVDDEGNFIRKLVDQLRSPTDVAVDMAFQRIFVSDTDGNKIHVFSTGDYSRMDYTISKFNKSSLTDPAGLAVDAIGRHLYVADTGNNRIGMFELVAPNKDCPTASTEAAPGICYVGDFGRSGDGDGEFAGPTGMAVDRAQLPNRGNLYVSDTDNNRIQVFSFPGGDGACPSGTERVADGVCLVESYGTNGTGNGEFNGPAGMAIDREKRLLYVADTGNDRIQVLNIGAVSTSASSTSSGSQSSSSSSSSSSQQSTASSSTPNTPRSAEAIPISPDSILVKWREPVPRGDSPLTIIGYKVESKTKLADGTSSSYETLVAKTSTNATSLHHTNLDPSTTYTYRVSAIATGDKTSNPSTATTGTKPASTSTPTIVDAVALNSGQVKISWLPPSDTFQQDISEFQIFQMIARSIDETVGTAGKSQNSFVYNVASSDGDEIELGVRAMFPLGNSPDSDIVTVQITDDSSHSGNIEPEVAEFVVLSVPSAPTKVSAATVSDTQIRVSWGPPTDNGNLEITGYTVEAKKKGSADFAEVASVTVGLEYLHAGLAPGSEYTYRVYAKNTEGKSAASSEVIASARTVGIKLTPINTITIDEGETASFRVTATGDSAAGATFTLSGDAPSGASISSGTGSFKWDTSSEDGGETYLFEVVAAQGTHSDKTTVRIKVNDVAAPVESPTQQQQPPQQTQQQPASQPAEPAAPALADFVEPGTDPQTYVDRYNNEPTYKAWFDENFADRYTSIYSAVGLPEVPASFVETGTDPQSYVDRYNNEPAYKQWFEDNHSEYDSIYHAVGLPEPDSAATATDPSTDPAAAPAGSGDNGETGGDEPPKEADEAPQTREMPRLDVPLAPFVDETADPQSYVDRYNSDASYKEWFDANYAAEYGTIYRAVGLLDVPAQFVEPGTDPQSYVDRYNSDASYKEWFDDNYGEYLSIYHAVGLNEPDAGAEPEPPAKVYGICGPGTKLVDGVCTIIATDEKDGA